MELLIVTGMSGAGKSHALRKLEDMGYYCVDNFPLALLPAFVDIAEQKQVERAAVCIDCRDKASLSGLCGAVDKLRAAGKQVAVLYLDAADDVLVRRYSETRRSHPLARNGLVSEGLREERQILAALCERADYYIDTSSFKPAQLGAAIESIGQLGKEPVTVLVQSFGFKRGIPPESDMMFDVRFLPNPFWIEELKAMSGLDRPVQEYVLGFEQTRAFIDDVTAMVVRYLPYYAKEGKHRLNLAIGCTGGRHRSVCVAQALYSRLREEGLDVVLTHRDIENDLQGRA